MMHPFLGKTFVPLELRHRDALAPLLAANPQPISGYTFATLAAWNAAYRYSWALWDPRTLLVAAAHHEGPELLMPVGELAADSEHRLADEILRLGAPVKLVGVTAAFLERHPALAGHFDAHDEPGGANYVYLAQDLAELPGRRYHNKRNLIAQAARATPWTVEALAPHRAEDCRAVVAQLPDLEGHPGKLQELAALGTSLDQLAALGLEGLVVKVAGKPVAFSLFERLDADTAVVHFEKAAPLKGLYQVVNYETSKLLHARGFRFINREEDANDAGLRKAKQSYLPVELRRQLTLVSRPRPAGWQGRPALEVDSGSRGCAPPCGL